jgi:hypothetical protein
MFWPFSIWSWNYISVYVYNCLGCLPYNGKQKQKGQWTYLLFSYDLQIYKQCTKIEYTRNFNLSLAEILLCMTAKLVSSSIDWKSKLIPTRGCDDLKSNNKQMRKGMGSIQLSPMWANMHRDKNALMHCGV